MEEAQNGNSQTQHHQESDPLEPSSLHDDFLEQMLSHLPNSPWPRHDSDDHPVSFPSFDDLTSKLRHHNSNSTSMAALLQQQLLLSRGAGDSVLNHLPLGAASLDSRLHHMQGADASVQALFNGGFPAPPLHGNGQTTTTTTTEPSQPPPFQAGGMGQAPGSASTAPQRQRVRARRGQATDPHSIAERLRRERIAERMKALQELVPNGNKTDKASMLDEIIDYVKFLQLQVKVLSMSRLGGASAAAAPRVAHLSSEGGRSSNKGNPGGAGSSNDGGMSITESQVVKLMEEDMGSAMQYLQGKGLCLMPISLATAICTATSNTRNNYSHRTQHHPPLHPSNIPPLIGNGNGNAGGGDGPSSPNLSGLTVQSANLVNGDGSIKDPNPPSKP